MADCTILIVGLKKKIRGVGGRACQRTPLVFRGFCFLSLGPLHYPKSQRANTPSEKVLSQQRAMTCLCVCVFKRGIHVWQDILLWYGYRINIYKPPRHHQQQSTNKQDAHLRWWCCSCCCWQFTALLGDGWPSLDHYILVCAIMLFLSILQWHEYSACAVDGGHKLSTNT